MAENNETKGKRELYIERLKAKYPDREYADDEALFGQVGEDYDAYENELNGFREREGKLTEMFDKDPRSAQFIADMARGENPIIAFIKRVGTDGIISVINDPEMEEAVREADKEYVERVALEKELEKEYNKNLEESKIIRNELDAQYGKEAVDKAIAVLNQMKNDTLLGKITRESVELALQLVNRDADIANARSEGEVAGRNAKIEEQVRKPQAGDGMPQIGGANAPAPAPKKRGFFDDLPRRKF